jgi:hypothetical protein
MGVMTGAGRILVGNVKRRDHVQVLDADESVILNLNSVNQLIFVMVKCGVLFEVRTEFLNNI